MKHRQTPRAPPAGQGEALHDLFLSQKRTKKEDRINPCVLEIKKSNYRKNTTTIYFLISMRLSILVLVFSVSVFIVFLNLHGLVCFHFRAARNFLENNKVSIYLSML